MPRGRGWYMSTNIVAANIAGTEVGAILNAEQIAKRAADIIDAVYAEKKDRNTLGLGDEPAGYEDVKLTIDDLGGIQEGGDK